MVRLARDIDRAHAVIRYFRLLGPHDGQDRFTWPKTEEGRRDLADFIYDQDDAYSARAVLDAPARMITYHTRKGPHD